MQRAQDLTPLEIVEMFVSVFCFLKDSCEVAQTLLEDFRSCQGYSFLSDFLLRYVRAAKIYTLIFLKLATFFPGWNRTVAVKRKKPLEI